MRNHEVILVLENMFKTASTYLIATLVLITGFQTLAFAKEKDKEGDKKENTTVKVEKDTIITVKKDISVEDTLVFDDLDEDKANDKSGSQNIIVIAGTKDINRNDEQANEFFHGNHELRSNSNQLESDSDDNEIGIIEVIPEQMNTTVFPNPATSGDEVNIRHSLDNEVTILVYRLDGSVVLSQKTIQKTISIPSMQTGMYIVQVSSLDQKEVKKLIVQ